MASRIIGDRGLKRSAIGPRRRVGVRFALQLASVLMATVLCACSARYKLSDPLLNDARRADAMESLYPLVSNRTILIYERSEGGETQLGSVVRERNRGRKLRRVLSRRDEGVIVGETTKNGAPWLWVSFDRNCAVAECALGFVRSENGRYHLASLPAVAGFRPPLAYRTLIMNRHELHLGKLASLTDANPVYRLDRKRKKKTHRSVFLELRKEKADTTDIDNDPFGGRR